MATKKTKPETERIFIARWNQKIDEEVKLVSIPVKKHADGTYYDPKGLFTVPSHADIQPL